MLYVGELHLPGSDDHEGYIAGRYRDGAYSGIWTDVRCCAERTFLAYAPACECGWRGAEHTPDPSGFAGAFTEWLDRHFRPFAAECSSTAAAARIVPADFLVPAAPGAPSAESRRPEIAG